MDGTCFTHARLTAIPRAKGSTAWGEVQYRTVAGCTIAAAVYSERPVGPVHLLPFWRLLSRNGYPSTIVGVVGEQPGPRLLLSTTHLRPVRINPGAGVGPSRQQPRGFAKCLLPGNHPSDLQHLAATDHFTWPRLTYMRRMPTDIPRAAGRGPSCGVVERTFASHSGSGVACRRPLAVSTASDGQRTRTVDMMATAAGSRGISQFPLIGRVLSGRRGRRRGFHCNSCGKPMAVDCPVEAGAAPTASGICRFGRCNSSRVHASLHRSEVEEEEASGLGTPCTP